MRLNTKEFKVNEFEEKIKEIYPEFAERIIDFHHGVRARKSFRICNLMDLESVLSNLDKEGVLCKKVYENIYITEDDSSSQNLSKTRSFLEKKIYIQELSSTLPVHVCTQFFDRSQNLKVIDLCASPGSKTTQIIETFRNSQVYANEPNKRRFFKLRQIVTDYGHQVNFLKFHAQKISKLNKSLRNQFDIVLCDVPCSNEGSLNLDSAKSMKYWTKKEPKHICKLQRGIINAGVELLNHGGILVYSTCTYSIEENEGVIYWLLKKRRDIRLVDFDIYPSQHVNGITQFFREKDLVCDLKKCKRVLPFDGWKAFFISVIKKV
ncbi:RsmB/NOP family class I SAM-dependent RNA methyltransferase [Candidatus Dojkabacteria bacterium]|uniref:RsmB/NOP family class I SAM-dependent RNA methyltransferase n=1 Tax=Candidatus Dojkabacteria bacterium TaxID=2099670 RepID=A0A3M0Z3R3_9BACT|nr:MAG: RsmB/NOP family class I SAM-dependent RNA methyltransferase [Candidatus Dojkabacteria bacterium]